MKIATPPLPPDLRRRFKKEAGKLASERAETVSRTRSACRGKVAAAKKEARAVIAKADAKHREERATLRAAVDAEAAKQRLAAKLAEQA